MSFSRRETFWFSRAAPRGASAFTNATVAGIGIRFVPNVRRNFLFVGTNEAGENLAGLYSLIATCEANEVNPVDYLADLLVRVQRHPASRIDELLPHNWKPPTPQPSA